VRRGLETRREPGSRICGAPLRAAPRPGHAGARRREVQGAARRDGRGRSPARPPTPASWSTRKSRNGARWSGAGISRRS